MIGYVLPSFIMWAIKGRDYCLWITGGLWSGNNGPKNRDAVGFKEIRTVLRMQR